MKPIIKIFIVVCLIMTTAVYSQDSHIPNGGSAEQLRINEVRDFLGAYLELVRNKDYSTMKSRWDPDSPNIKSYFVTAEKILGGIEDIDVVRFEVHRLTEEGEKINAEARVELKSVDSKNKNPARVYDTDNRFFVLSSTNGEWKIVRHESLESHVADRLADEPEKARRAAILKEYEGLLPIAITRALVRKGVATIFQPGGAFAAVDMLERALETAQFYDDRSHLASILPNLGLAYKNTGEYQKSIEYFERTIELSREIKDPYLESTVWTGLGTTYAFLGDHNKSLEALLKGFEYMEKAGSKRDLIIPLINLASSYSILREYDRTIDLQNRALNVFGEIGESDPSVLKDPGFATLLGNIGKTYADLGISDKAIEFYEAAAKLNDEIGRRDGGNLFNIAYLYSSLGEFGKAEEFFNRSYEMFAANKNKQGMEVALNGIGDIYRARGDLTKSLEYKLKALDVSIELGQPGRIDTSRMLVADAHFRLGENTAAIQVASDIADRPPTPGFEGLYREANYLTGKILQISGELAKSERYLRKAILVAEEQRRVSRLNLKPYHELIRLQIKQGNLNTAFETAQSTKSRNLLDIFLRRKESISKSLSSEELETERKFKSEIVALGAQIAAERTRKPLRPGRIQELEDEQTRKRLQLDSFENQLYTRHPELKVFRGDLNAVTASDIPGLLRDRSSAVAEFIVAEDFAVLFVLSLGETGNSVVKSHFLDLTQSELEKSVKNFNSTLAKGDLDFQSGSRDLFARLLKSAENDLIGKTNLIIVPDGPLWDLPFQALMDEKGKYLVEKVAISYAPSLTALREMSKKAGTRNAGPDAELIAFGNPIVGKETKERVQRVFMSEELEPLPEAERLVNELGKMYGPKRSKVLIGNEAREEVAKSETSKYRIVLFATHGILNNTSPIYSHLVLSQDAKNPNEDGLLEAWELKDLNLKADMVILSACDTARGKVSGGEGIIGMTWASFIAGSPTTVASQWKVESASTTDFMLEFHRQLLAKKRISKAEAMRRAALKLMRTPKYRHPSYWGAWVLVGDGS